MSLSLFLSRNVISNFKPNLRFAILSSILRYEMGFYKKLAFQLYYHGRQLHQCGICTLQLPCPYHQLKHAEVTIPAIIDFPVFCFCFCVVNSAIVSIAYCSLLFVEKSTARTPDRQLKMVWTVLFSLMGSCEVLFHRIQNSSDTKRLIKLGSVL